jgi:glycosyltransferase involved in cell wall biosynthesis
MKTPLFYILFCFIGTCFCEEPATVSVVIPCERSHIQFLPELLNALKNQSVIPTEVVISISSTNSQDDFLICQIAQDKYPFIFKLLSTSKRQFAGENRNIAISHSKGDIIICQDADDLPHRQRVEIIRNLFQETRFDYLLHLHFLAKSEITYEDYQKYNALEYPVNTFEFLVINPATDLFKIPKTHPEFFTRYLHDPALLRSLGIHFGNCSFKRNVFDQVQYSSMRSGQDVNFFSNVIRKFDNILLLNLPLIYYINSRSTMLIREQ